MGRLAIALASGLLFGTGLGLSGMTDPAHVRGFLDLAGAWDPALGVVMIGATGTAFAGYRLLALRGDGFKPPPRRRVDARLVAGALLFGIGWGLVGLCPGPAIADLSTGSPSVALFTAAMLAGMALFSLTRRKDHDS